MKKTSTRILSTLLTLLLLLSLLALSACDDTGASTPSDAENPSGDTDDTGNAGDAGNTGDEIEASGLWADAVYRTDTTLGTGAKTLNVRLEVEGKSLLFTVKTDATTVGEALLAQGLIAGEDGPFGLYVKNVNGIRADYDTDGAYWAFYLGEAYAPTGMDQTAIDESVTYRIVYAR